MWTITTWSRNTGQWYHMRGFHDGGQACERAKKWAKEMLPLTVISLSDPDGIVVWAAIGSHPTIGHCETPVICWCGEFSKEYDHTVKLGSSNA